VLSPLTHVLPPLSLSCLYLAPPLPQTAPPTGSTGCFKVGGNYAPGLLPQREAANKGYSQVTYKQKKGYSQVTKKQKEGYSQVTTKQYVLTAHTHQDTAYDFQ